MNSENGCLSHKTGKVVFFLIKKFSFFNNLGINNLYLCSGINNQKKKQPINYKYYEKT